MKLIQDPNVKEKQKAKYRELLKKMKDFRNVINLIAVINVFGIIADYQRWGQKEKASAFERKYARKLLRMKMKELDDRAKIEKIVEEKFSFIDFEKK